jgi:hypothetical protein
VKKPAGYQLRSLNKMVAELLVIAGMPRKNSPTFAFLVSELTVSVWHRHSGIRVSRVTGTAGHRLVWHCPAMRSGHTGNYISLIPSSFTSVLSLYYGDTLAMIPPPSQRAEVWTLVPVAAGRCGEGGGGGGG